MNIYSTAILISILVYIAVGIYAGRKVKDVEQYMVAGRQAPTLFIVGTLVASYLSTNTFLAETGMAYGVNAGGWILFPAIATAGYIYGAVFFGRYLRRSRSLTVAEYFGNRFESRRVQLVAGITVVIGIGCYLIAVTQGSAIILSNLTELSYTQSIFVVKLHIGHPVFRLTRCCLDRHHDVSVIYRRKFYRVVCDPRSAWWLAYGSRWAR